MTPDGRNLTRLWWLAVTAAALVVLLVLLAELPPTVGDYLHWR